MSWHGDGDRLPPAVQLVYEDGNWAIYDGADNARSVVGPAGLPECLSAAGGVTSSDEDPAPYDRASWASRGWSAAYDFAVSLHRSADPIALARPVGGTGPPGAARGIVEHYPPAPSAPPLRRDKLLSYLRQVQPHDAAPPVELAVAAIAVDGMAPGWYRWDGSEWPGAALGLAAADLDRISPVAFGRAGYFVEALVILAAVQPDLEMLGARAYARLLVTGGSVLSRLEGIACDAGLSCRGNYAVDASVGDSLGIAAGHLLLIGAVALGGR